MKEKIKGTVSKKKFDQKVYKKYLGYFQEIATKKTPGIIAIYSEKNNGSSVFVNEMSGIDIIHMIENLINLATEQIKDGKKEDFLELLFSSLRKGFLQKIKK